MPQHQVAFVFDPDGNNIEAVTTPEMGFIPI